MRRRASRLRDSRAGFERRSMCRAAARHSEPVPRPRPAGRPRAEGESRRRSKILVLWYLASYLILVVHDDHMLIHMGQLVYITLGASIDICAIRVSIYVESSTYAKLSANFKKTRSLSQGCGRTETTISRSGSMCPNRPTVRLRADLSTSGMETNSSSPAIGWYSDPPFQ